MSHREQEALLFRRFAFWGSVTVLLGSGWYFHNAYLFLVAEGMLLVALASLFSLTLAMKKLKLHRNAPPRAFEGQKITAEIVISQLFWTPLRNVIVTDSFGASLFSEQTFALPLLWPGEHRLSYEVECQNERGVYPLGPLAITAQDSLGIWQKGWRETSVGTFTVLPTPSPLPIHLCGGRVAFLGRAKGSSRAGIGYDYLGTREWRPGDSLRYIHWPATAHRGKLIVREFETDTQSQVTFFLDLSQKALQGFRPHTLDYAIKVVASLALSAQNEGLWFRLFAHGSAPITFPLGQGSAHYAQLLELLATLRPSGEVPFEEMVQRCIDELEVGETVFLVVCTHVASVEALSQIITEMRVRDIEVTVVLIISESFEKLWVPQDYLEEQNLPTLLAYQQARVYAVEKGVPLDKSFGREVSL